MYNWKFRYFIQRRTENFGEEFFEIVKVNLICQKGLQEKSRDGNLLFTKFENLFTKWKIYASGVR